MNDHPHSHDEHNPSAETPLDAGSQALTEALRSSFAIVKVVMVLLVIVFLGSGLFQVGNTERAIILRFGKPVGDGEKMLLGPGLHFGYPPPIDEVQRVSVTGVQTADSTVGWYATTPEMELAGTEPYAGPTLNPLTDGYTLTADGNIIHVRARLTYRIEDPRRYIFDFTNAPAVVTNALDNALIYASATYKVDDILTRDKLGFQEAIKKRVTELLDAQKVGVIVERCEADTRPPRQQTVRDAFLNVLHAEINRNQLLSDAFSYTNQVLTRAGADASSLTNLAETARVQLINDLASRATNFSALLPRYRENPELFVQQQLVQTMGRVLTNVHEKWYVPAGSGGKPIGLWLQLNREAPKPPGVSTNR
jgi:membrane protease subunit HflK